jgi:hypothetical protein
MTDPLLNRLRALPAHDLEPASVERLRRDAQAALRQSTQRSRFAAAWSDVLEPALVAGVIVLYGGWGLSTIASLFRAV